MSARKAAKKRKTVNYVIPLDLGEKRLAVARARARVLKFCRKKGFITTRQAAAVGQWKQAYYHLRALEQARLLKREGFNRWVIR